MLFGDYFIVILYKYPHFTEISANAFGNISVEFIVHKAFKLAVVNLRLVKILRL